MSDNELDKILEEIRRYSETKQIPVDETKEEEKTTAALTRTAKECSFRPILTIVRPFILI